MVVPVVNCSTWLPAPCVFKVVKLTKVGFSTFLGICTSAAFRQTLNFKTSELSKTILLVEKVTNSNEVSFSGINGADRENLPVRIRSNFRKSDVWAY